MNEDKITADGGLYLRKLQTSDAALLHAGFTDEESAVYFLQKKYRNFHDTETLVEWLCTSGNYFVVVRERDDQVIGLAGTRPLQGRSGVVRLAYMINQRYRGRGIMPKVIRAVTEYELGKPGICRIEAAIRPDNIRSLRCIEKAGYHMEKMIDSDPEQPGDEVMKKRILYVREQSLSASEDSD